jgi:hypothetical protein
MTKGDDAADGPPEPLEESSSAPSGDRLTPPFVLRMLSGGSPRLMSGQLRRALAALVALPLLLVAVSTSAWAMRCEALGLVVSSCCCPKPAQARGAAEGSTTEAPAPEAALGAARCCALESNDVVQPAGEQQTSPPRLAPPVATAAAHGPLDPGPCRQTLRLTRAAGRAPPPSTPILLAKSSLLL